MMICMIMCSLISTLLHLSEKVCRSILLAARLSTCWPRQYNLIPVFYYPSLHQGSLKVLKIDFFYNLLQKGLELK